MANMHLIFSITELNDEDIVSQAIIFFLAGFDTASTVLCFICHQLATHPDIQTRLQEEIDKTLQENGGKFTYEAIHGMKYLDMVVSGENRSCLCMHIHTQTECKDCPSLSFTMDILVLSLRDKFISSFVLLLVVRFSDMECSCETDFILVCTCSL
jgi:hypothetical protein